MIVAGDCREIMAQHGPFDCIIADPPYGDTSCRSGASGVLMLLDAGAKVTNLGDVKWLATEDGSPGKGTGRHIACFVLEPKP